MNSRHVHNDLALQYFLFTIIRVNWIRFIQSKASAPSADLVRAVTTLSFYAQVHKQVLPVRAGGMVLLHVQRLQRIQQPKVSMNLGPKNLVRLHEILNTEPNGIESIIEVCKLIHIICNLIFDVTCLSWIAKWVRTSSAANQA